MLERIISQVGSDLFNEVVVQNPDVVSQLESLGGPIGSVEQVLEGVQRNEEINDIVSL